MSIERVVQELTVRGGVAPRSALPVGKRALAAALSAEVVVRRCRGVYALAGAERDLDLDLARTVHGARSHRSAAAAFGWCEPARAEITVRRGSRIPTEVRSRAHVTWGALSQAEVVDALTHPVRTVVDCLVAHADAEGLAIADAAVRSGVVTPEEVGAALALDRRRGVRAAREVARMIDGRAESPLESRLRYVALDVPKVHLIPQVQIGGPGWRARVDLADPRLGIVAEADSFAWHGSRAALARDARRYDRIASAGWRILRFTYEAVMFEPEWVGRQVRACAGIQADMVSAGIVPWRRSVVDASLPSIIDDQTLVVGRAAAS